MKRDEKYSPRVQIAAQILLLLLLAAGVSPLKPPAFAAETASLSGLITDTQTQLPIDGATVSVSDGIRSYTARTDGFGMYRLEGMEPGTYTLEARHPGYHSGSQAEFPLAAGRHRWQKALTLKEPFFDLFVEVSCVTTGMKLKGIPVRIASAGTDWTAWTDDRGFVHFPGLPKGYYSFFINTGNGMNGRWESYEKAVSDRELTGHHWADVLLKPIPSSLVASVYGFDPVTEQYGLLQGVVVECEGVHPEDPTIPLLPPQIGVSGIRKDNVIGWDNGMVGKVRFAGLPPIHWVLRGKRLGYHKGESTVTSLPEDNARIEMALQDSRLTVIVETPYNDPEMLAGLKVRLQGLQDTNTAGIDRIRTVTYEVDKKRAVVVFDKILPGNYLATVQDTVFRHVPILIEGSDINAGKDNAYSRFSVRLSGSDYLDAFADQNAEATLFCQPEPMTFTGKLLLADELQNPDFAFFRDALPKHYPGADKTLEFRASEYYAASMPDAYRRVEVKTDATGEFSVTLLPGLYGVVSPDLASYWGSALELTDVLTNTTKSTEWPYYQIWPYSLKSAQAFQRARFAGITSIGGVAVSSGQLLQGRLYALKKVFGAELLVYGSTVWKSPTEHQVVALDRSESTGTDKLPDIFFKTLYAELADGGSATLAGPISKTAALVNRNGQSRALLEGLPSGDYLLSIDHPRYNHLAEEYAGPYPYIFSFASFPDAGLVPTAPFPEDYDVLKAVFPLGVKPLDAILQAKSYGTAEVELFHWQNLNENEQGYASISKTVPQFIRPDYSGKPVFYYTQQWRAGTPGSPYSMWLCLKNEYLFGDLNEHWYLFGSSGGDLKAKIYIGGPTPSAQTEPLQIAYDIHVEARELNASGPTIPGVNVSWYDVLDNPSETVATTSGASIEDRTTPLNLYGLTATHEKWRFNGHKVDFLGVASNGKAAYRLTLFMVRGLSLKGAVADASTGHPLEGVSIRLWNRYGTVSRQGTPTLADGTFTWPSALTDATWFLEAAAPGYEPALIRLDGNMAVFNPQEKTNDYILEGDKTLRLKPLPRPLIDRSSLSMDRRGAFLPGVKKSGNQTVFNAFIADGALTLTWNLDIGLAQKEYSVTLPGFDNEDGSPGADRTVVLKEDLQEVWLVDRKAFPNSPYNDPPVLLNLPEAPEPAQARAFLEKIRNGAEGFRNVYFQRLTDFTTSPSSPDLLKVTGKVKLWQLPPDLFRPAFVAVTKLGAISVYPVEYTDHLAGKELTGARLPPWFAGLQDLLGTVAAYRGMLGDGLKNALPEGKVIALPAFTGNILLRATNTLDYVYSIDIEIKEGMANKLGGILGMAPGFMGLSLYGGLEATLKGEDRQFNVRTLGGVTGNKINAMELTPWFFQGLEGFKLKLNPPPQGSFESLNSIRFDPDNRPDELAVFYGINGSTGIEASQSIFPFLKYIPKIGPVLYGLYKSGAMDIQGVVSGLVGARCLTGFKTLFPHQREHHYEYQGGPETRQLRRSFLGGDEVGLAELAQKEHPDKTVKVELAMGFGLGVNASLARERLGAKGSVQVSGDDAPWAGAPSLLLETNVNGDWPVVKRARGDLRAVLEAYLDAWVVRFQKRWFWKFWPLDYQFGTESAMHLMELEITTQRRDLAAGPPSEFMGQEPVLVDKAPLLMTSRIASGTSGDLLLYTDKAPSGSGMVLKASLRQKGGGWGTPVVIASVSGLALSADVIALDGGGWLAVWTEVSHDSAEALYPASRIQYATGTADGATWSPAAEVAALDDVAEGGRLVPHGGHIALVYTETREGPTGKGDGLSALVWDGKAWSAPRKLTAATIAGFEALGSRDLSSRPTLVAFTGDNDTLHMLEWNETASPPLTLKAGSGTALALAWGTEQAYLAYGLQGGGIGLLQRDDVSGIWTDRGIPFPEGTPRSLSLAFLRENGRDYTVCAWTQAEGQTTHLYYGAIDTGDPDIRAITRIPAPLGGDFRNPALGTGGQEGTLELSALLSTAEGVSSVHNYRLPQGLNIPWGDINRDGMVNLLDFITVLKVLAGNAPSELPGKSLADINATGRIDLGDALYILRVLGTR